MQTASRRVINGWAMYDWASSSYNLVITSTIFPTYFEAIAVDNAAVSKTTVTFLGRQFENTSLYNYAIALAMFIVALMSPLLSSRVPSWTSSPRAGLSQNGRTRRTRCR